MTGRAVTAKTPGQAACAAWWATAEGVPSPPDVTYDQDAKAWEASAQAAIKASGLAKTPEQVGEIAGYVSGQIARERDQARAETRRLQDAVLADLGQLLEVLGLGDYARPESPHEVFGQCVAKARELLAERDRLRGQLADAVKRAERLAEGSTT